MTDHAPQQNIIIAIVAQNENSALRVSSEGLGRDWASRGYRHRIIDMFTASGAHELVALLASGEVAFAYGFAGVGSQFSLQNGVNLWTASRTPYIALWFDHPAYNYRQHIVDSPYVVHAYHVRDHMDVRQAYLPASTSSSILLHILCSTIPPQYNRPFREREKRIFFVKTGKQPELIIKDWERHPPKVQAILRELALCGQKDRNIDLIGTAIPMLRNAGASPDKLDVLMGIVAEVDNYIRAWRSDRLARALLPHPALIVGRGWDYLKSYPHQAEFSPAIPAHEYIARIQNYRINANSNPLWRDGIHERVLMGFYFGSIVVTDRTEKSDEIFHGLDNYLSFDWQDDLQDVLATALSLADHDDADFLPATESVVKKRFSSKVPNYFQEIECIVAAVRKQKS